MISERRAKPRVNTHLVIKLIDKRDMKQYFGYIEDLSEGGMGIAALDSLLSGTQASTLFFLPELSIKLLPVATVVYAKKKADMLNYYGLRFYYNSQADR